MNSRKMDKTSYILKGTILAYIVTGIIIVILALLLRFTSLNEGKIPLLAIITMSVSIVIGAIYVASKVQENGWINGGIVGAVYFLVLIILGYIFNKSFNINFALMTRLILTIVAGVVGGIIGINITS